MPLAALHPLVHGRMPRLFVAGAGALLLGACQPAPPPGNATPDQAVATSLNLTATGDFDALMKNRLPAADYAAWREEWSRQRAQRNPAPIEQQEHFAGVMQMLTEPDAEANLGKRLAPMLSKLHGGRGEALPIFGSIIEAAASQMIAASPQLGPVQRALATQGVDALTAWAKTTDFSDPGKARKAIAQATTTARALHLKTLAEWCGLDYATAMHDYGILWTGLQKVLRLYGLDVADSLAHARVRTISNDGSHAVVELTLTLAGKPLRGQWPMVRQDGRWYDATLLEAWHRAHATATSVALPATPATAAAAPAPPAGTSPGPPGATHEPPPSGDG